MRLVATIDWFDPDAPDAAVRTLWETARALRRAGHEVIIVAGGPTEDEVTRDRIIIRTARRDGAAGSLAGRRSWQPRLRRLVEGAAREADAQFIWMHRTLAVEAVVPVTGQLDLPLLCSVYAPWEDEMAAFGGALVRWRERKHRRAFEERALRTAACVFAASAPLTAALQTAHPRLAETCRTGPVAVDPGRFAPRAERDLERAALQLSPDTFSVVVARHLVAGCGVDDLIDAVAQLADEFPTLRLAILGHGPAARGLQATALASLAAARIRWVGATSDDTLARWLGTADLAVAPATSPDWSGVTLLEAHACGTPVLATPPADTTGRAAAVDAALVTDGTGSAALAASLRVWAGAQDQLAAMRERCAMSVGSGTTWTNVASDLTHVLESL